jgi:hypothetical protein
VSPSQTGYRLAVPRWRNPSVALTGAIPQTGAAPQKPRVPGRPRASGLGLPAGCGCTFETQHLPNSRNQPNFPSTERCEFLTGGSAARPPRPAGYRAALGSGTQIKILNA